jgi:sugar/nucleoside kinase (ribokinase family)
MKKADVYGVGNSLVDTIAFVDSDFIREHDLTPGSMTLVDADKQARLLHALGKHSLELRSGGSAANTMIALGRSGGSAFYTGKVSRDTNGEFYKQDLLEAGIHFDVHPAQVTDGPNRNMRRAYHPGRRENHAHAPGRFHTADRRRHG